MKPVAGICVSLITSFLLAMSAGAVEQIHYDTLHPEEEYRLVPDFTGFLPAGSSVGVFRFGGWPPQATNPPPFPRTGIAVVTGTQQDRSWANAFLLRGNPASYSWVTNPKTSGIDQKLRMGKDPIIISFDQPICAFGVIYAQSGAHNPHHPDLRKRTSFSFFDQTGQKIAVLDQKPGHFISKAAFQRSWRDPFIWAVAVDSEVYFALKEISAMPCSELLG